MNWNIKIKELRDKLCLTQTEFAELLGISFVSINRYENGKSIPTMKVKRKIKVLLEQEGIKEE